MAKNPKAGIEVGVNDRPAVEGLRNLAKSFGAFSVQAAASLQLAQAGWRALTGTIMGVVDATSEYVQLAMEQERVERRAMAALQSRQTFTRAELDLLQQANAARQQQLGIGDEVQLQLQGTLASMGVAKGQIDAATRAAIGLSDAMGMGLLEAGKIAGKAFTGNVGALKEYGIQARSVADAQAQLNALYDVAAANSRTLETRLAVLNANVGDFKEVLGGAVTQSTALQKGVDAISSAVLELQGYFASAEGRQAVNGFFGVILDLSGDAINAMLGAYKMVQEFRGEGERGGFLSRVGGAGRLLGALNPGVIIARMMGFGGGTGAGAREVDEAFAQLMGRGQGAATQSSPMLLTLENMADALKKAALAAREANVEVTKLTGGGGGGGGGKGPRLRELVGYMTIESPEQVHLRQLESEIKTQMAIEAGLRQAMAESQAALAREQADLERQIETERVTERNQARMDAYQQEQEAAKAHYQVLGDLTKQGAGIVSNSISDLLVAWASGADMAEMTVGKFVGTMISQIGVMLIQTGIAATVLGALSFIPGLQGIAGPPGLGILGGLAATGAGVAMVALGSAMGGGAPRGGAASASRGGSGGATGSRGFDPVPRGFSGSPTDMAAAPSYTVNVSFGVVGDERRAARMIRDVLERGR